MIGKTLGGYRILEQAGAGGMATVWKAYDPGTDRIIALKTLPHQYSSDPSFRARFEQEARAIARLEHLHILPVFAYGEEDGIAYMAMRYLDTGTLSKLIHSRVLPLEEVARLLHQIASALDYAHQHGILHRDIKPSNVLIDADGNAFLTDFGIAKIVGGGLGLTGSALIGTPQYMSPEQCLGQKDLTPAADQYSLGVMLYEMVTGHTPYQAETPVAIIQKHIVGEPLLLPALMRPDLPESAQQVILKALAREPGERYENCTALAQAFSIALRSEPTASAQRRTALAATHASAQEEATLVDGPDSAHAPTSAKGGQATAAASALAPAASASRLPFAWILGAVLLVAVVIVALLALGQGQRDGAGQAAVGSATFTEAAPPSDTPAPSATFTPDLPPTPATPLARARRDLELRAGPGPDFAALTTVASGDELEITGISSDGRWYEVLLPDGRRGWLIASSAMTELLGSAAVLPSIVPPTLTPTATHTPEPTATATASHTPEPTATATATHTPEPTATATATHTPEASDTPRAAAAEEARFLVACGPLHRRLCILNNWGEVLEQINPGLPAEYLNIGSINWSRDGTFAIFHVRYKDLRHQLMRYDFSTATLSNLTGGTVYNNLVPALSPNEEWVAFHANCALHVIRLDGHNRRVLRSWPGRCVMQIRWAPDGRTLFALLAPTASQGAGVVLALPFDREGTELRLLYQLGLERDGEWHLLLSPDGTELRVQMPGLRLSVDTGCIAAGCREFPVREAPELNFPAAWGLNIYPRPLLQAAVPDEDSADVSDPWLESASALRFLVGCGPLNRHLCIVDELNQRLEEIDIGLPEVFFDISHINWSRDAAFAIFATQNRVDHGDLRIMRYDFADHTLQMLTQGPAHVYPALSPDDRLVLFHGGCQTLLVTSDGQRERVLLPYSVDRCCQLFRWSPDGQNVAILSTTPNVGDIAAIEVALLRAGDANSLTPIFSIPDPGAQHPFDMAWSPDGSMLLVLAGSRTTRIELDCLGEGCTEYPASEFAGRIPREWQPNVQPHWTEQRP